MTQGTGSDSQPDDTSTPPKLAISKGAGGFVESTPLFEYLTSAASDFPDRTWISYGERKISYRDGLSVVEKLAAALCAQGLTKGDRVAVCLPNDTFYPLFAYACWRQGIVLVGINSLYAVPMLTQIFTDADPKLIITRDDPELLLRIIKSRDASCASKILALPVHGDAIQALDDSEPTSNGTISLTEFSNSCAAVHPAAVNAQDDIAVLQYTGGTTGSPKGAMLTHGTISSCVSQLRLGMPKLRRGEEIYIAIGPFAHVIGTTLILAAVTSIASEILIESRFHPVESIQLCIDRKVSVLFGVPTMFGAIASSPSSQGADWSHLRYAMCGGAPLPRQIAIAFESVTGCEVLQGYGLSESSGGVALSPPGMTLPEGAVGHPIAGCQVEVRSLDDRTKLVSIHEIGEICAAGPQIMRGYWQQPEKTAEVMIGRFLATGDTGYIDETGAIHIVDRIKDLIIASGFNVYPSAVEDALYMHPAIREAAVIGEKDDYRGETVKAVVSLNAGRSLDLESLQTFLRSKLSPIEIPKLLEIRDDLPKTAVGKISKLDLR